MFVSKNFLLKGLIFSLLIFFLLSNFCLAQGAAGEIEKGLESAGKAAGFTEEGQKEKSMIEITGGVIKVVVSLLGVILACFLIWGGVQWMTSGGNEEQIKKAKGLINNAIIGLVIVVFAYAIAAFVINSLSEATEKKKKTSLRQPQIIVLTNRFKSVSLKPSSLWNLQV